MTKPILFSAPMVRAILDGSKTQTRRVMKVQPPNDKYQICTLMDTTGDRKNIGKKHWALLDGVNMVDSKQPYWNKPYEIGDRLWVRETWAAPVTMNDIRPRDIVSGTKVEYRASYSNASHFVWRPSLFMPRWASRIELEVTNLRYERLNDISDADAINEGIEQDPDCYLRAWRNYEFISAHPPHNHKIKAWGHAKDSFRSLWNSINGDSVSKNWAANPMVWVIEFQKVKPC